MDESNPTMDKLIIDHINELRSLVAESIEWMESQTTLEDYEFGLAVIAGTLLWHAEKMLELRERFVRQLASKCGPAGRDIYGKELGNIRIRNRFARIAEFFTHKP